MASLPSIRRRSVSALFNLFRSQRRAPQRAGLPSRFRPRLELLEDRWVPATITINGSVTLDESLGLQKSGVPVAGEDNNDSDVSLDTFKAGSLTCYNRLFGPGGLGLDPTFATTNGVAQSASNFITVNASDGTVTSLGFVKEDGTALPVYANVPGGGVVTTLSAVDGGPISLFADTAPLGNRMVLGVDADNDIVFSIC